MYPTAEEFKKTGYFGFNYKLLGSQYEDFGNFMFGYLGTKAGLAPATLWYGAGAYQANKDAVYKKDGALLYYWNWRDDSSDVPHVQNGIFSSMFGF